MQGHHHPCHDLHDRDHPHHLDHDHLDHDQMELGADLPPMLGRLCSCLAPRPSWTIPSPLCPGYPHHHDDISSITIVIVIIIVIAPVSLLL